mmetsp:Transcript_12964/g.20995  ORF Transcript_12964/g.20995 Transcript_12964/m.20995 type:complete len:337 (+) Transcript_12964:88-1098(+)|eukprot:CAMPEP_0203785436 /NCGR_PEP_ID=MMETSP0100_2-20121128/1032_1 /ASSEMBLY_ACC=CAM_ASM_000210 /TAXON_ID=96639 /ORGANISM=" , Strain NY0313808BC1" /LENGTH=336 /DNA_ID=CAMNT_0050687551 /DNA_START=68 /DNA_END=1078 /DNA_ORIENTATION=+
MILKLPVIALSFVVAATGLVVDNVPLNDEQRVVYADYMQLQAWVYTLHADRDPVVPLGYENVADGERWAILKSTNASHVFKQGKCLLIHRGTFDSEEAIDDLKSQFAPPIDINGIQINGAFWDSYARYETEQTKALEKAFNDSSCVELDITGHSLGGAVTMVALAHLSARFHVADVIASAPPRSVYRLLNETNQDVCEKVNGLVKGTLVRFNRAAHDYHEFTTALHDPIGAFPLSLKYTGVAWSHCAKVHVKILSDDMEGGNFAIEEADSEFPKDSLLKGDDFLLWLQGETSLWHNPILYAQGLRSSLDRSSSASTHSPSIFPLAFSVIVAFRLFV